MIVEDLMQGAGGVAEAAPKSLHARHHLFPEIVSILRRYVDTKVTFTADVDRRELGLEKYASLLRERIRENILPDATTKEAPLLPVINSYRPSVTTAEVNYSTTRPVVRLTKSHLNLAMIQSAWEREAVDILEDLQSVECYTPNDRNVGLAVPYEYQGHARQYEPDFVVKMRGGKLVMLEIKGKAGEVHGEDVVLAKNAAAKKWVAAVNHTKRFGRWEFEICRELSQLRRALEKHADGAGALPFRYVTPSKDDRFETCVPLISLRAAAGDWGEEQFGFDPAEWADEWITYDASNRFEPGMFVARVQGDSMAPLIPDGAYCLFRRPRGGTRQNRKLLVWHSGIVDPHTGGHFTLKVYSSERVGDLENEWQHTRIVLKPLNQAYEPIVLTPQEEGEIREIAEFVEVVG